MYLQIHLVYHHTELIHLNDFTNFGTVYPLVNLAWMLLEIHRIWNKFDLGPFPFSLILWFQVLSLAVLLMWVISIAYGIRIHLHQKDVGESQILNMLSLVPREHIQITAMKFTCFGRKVFWKWCKLFYFLRLD